MAPAKAAEPIDMPFGFWTPVGPRNRVLLGVQMLMGNGNFEGKGRLIVKCREHRPCGAAMWPSVKLL